MTRANTKKPAGLNAGFMLRVNDDSMIKANIRKGDWVYLLRPTADKQIKNGSIVAVILWGQVFLRRFYKNQKGDIIRLRPENSTGVSLTINTQQEQEPKIIGEAVGLIDNFGGAA